VAEAQKEEKRAFGIKGSKPVRQVIDVEVLLEIGQPVHIGA
jgi:hypothetical protein